MYITERAGSHFSVICLGKVKSDARPDQLVAFTRRFREALPIEDRDLPSGRAQSNQHVPAPRAAFVMVGLWTPSISASRL